MAREQSPGRERNDAAPADRPDPRTPDDQVEHVGRQSRERAGPDGPDAREVGDTFKS